MNILKVTYLKMESWKLHFDLISYRVLESLIFCIRLISTSNLHLIACCWILTFNLNVENNFDNNGKLNSCLYFHAVLLVPSQSWNFCLRSRQMMSIIGGCDHFWMLGKEWKNVTWRQCGENAKIKKQEGSDEKYLIRLYIFMEASLLSCARDSICEIFLF